MEYLLLIHRRNKYKDILTINSVNIKKIHFSHPKKHKVFGEVVNAFIDGTAKRTPKTNLFEE